MLQKVNEWLVPFGLQAEEVKKLIGYSSSNYKLTDAKGRMYVLKHYTDPEELLILREEIKIVNEIRDNIPFQIAETLVNNNGTIHFHDDKSYSRLLPFIEGEFLAEVDPGPTLLRSFGKSMALIDKELSEKKAPNIAARKSDWDLQYALLNKSLTKHIKESERRILVHYFFDQFGIFALPVLNNLKQQVIHNDFNDWNVLCRDEMICGLIDFGDIAFAPRICELAIGLAYVMMNKELPIAVACEVIKGYCDELPFTEEEIKILPHLIIARLCTSVCNSAKAKSESTDTEYIMISEKGAWDLIEKWIKWNPILLEISFLKAAGQVRSANM